MGYIPQDSAGFRKRLLLQFLSFASAGAAGTVVQYVLLFLLVEWLSMHPISASILGFLSGAVVNYLLSYHWVFRSSLDHAEAISKFVAIAWVGLVLNAAIMWVLVTIAGMHYFHGQVAATGIVLFWNFLGNRFWTFANETGNA
ncbi:MAG TPA: GtrA family protein [Gallionella sp.]|nr:GtrA family protein [Gallionella sp.]